MPGSPWAAGMAKVVAVPSTLTSSAPPGAAAAAAAVVVVVVLAVAVTAPAIARIEPFGINQQFTSRVDDEDDVRAEIRQAGC